MTSPSYVELQATTYFSFLRGASSPDELFAQARSMGLEALGITDRHSLAGMVQAHQAAKTHGVRLIVGCRLDLTEGVSLLVYPTDKAAYSRLCRLLSLGKARAGKGKCHLGWSDLAAWQEGLLAVLIPDAADEALRFHLHKLRTLFGDRAYLALTLRRRPNDHLRLYELCLLAKAADVPPVVTNDVLFHHPDRRLLQDTVTCIRHNCTIDGLGFRRERHADRHLKAPEEMTRLFRLYPDALDRTHEILTRCAFSMAELEYQYPDEKTHPELTPQDTLEKFTREGAANRYPKGVPDKVSQQLNKELSLIGRLNYAAYFLTVHAIVQFARSQGIICQGRGSAANSAVCFVLGITEVNPMEHDLLFERFISENRNEPPDKDDIDALKFMKVDCLALGMLSAMRRSFDLLKEHKHITNARGSALNMADIPAEDKATYDMICKADTIGVFQIESRAQMSMLPRLRPRAFYDLAIEVAIVRPGPIQGDMVHPYLRRKHGREAVDYPNPELEAILGRTYGVPLFQEHAMRVAVVCAGFTADEADHVRRSLATFKHTGGVKNFRDKMIEGMLARGFALEYAERMVKQLEGFGSYGFPESHAISFAMIAYASSWMKCHHPDVFLCALLNSQPMGFYAPAQLVRDARDHDVEVRPVCVNASRWDCTLESNGDKLAVRLGLRMVKGLSNKDAAGLITIRDTGAYLSVTDVWHRSGLPVSTLITLAEADGFATSLGQSRRDALWALKGLRDAPLPLFDTMTEAAEPEVTLRPMTAGHEVVADYGHVGLSLKQHPLSFLRGDLSRRGIVPCKVGTAQMDKSNAVLAGMVLVRQRPGTAKNVTFMTIEDETGVANIVVWSRLYEEQRRLILTARMIAVEGQIQKEGEVVHLVARHLYDLSAELDSVSQRNDAFALPRSRGDDFRNGEPGEDPRVFNRTGSRAAQPPAILVKSRDFK